MLVEATTLLQLRGRFRSSLALIVGLTLVCSAACTSAPTPVPTIAPATTSTPEPTLAPTPQPTTFPAPTPNPQQQAFGMKAPLPLSGEFVVTANMDDHTLSVVPVGAAAVATTVQLDLAPIAVGAAPNSDTVFAADGSRDSHEVAVATLNDSSQSGTIDVGTRAGEVSGPPPSGPASPMLVVGDSDNTVLSVDP